MKLFAYGDSWTEGKGADPIKEEAIEFIEKRKHFRNSKSWPKVLSRLMGLPSYNNSTSGINNNTIFNQLITDIKSETIQSGDLVIIMWSSSLRDDVPFFPLTEWHTWGVNYISEPHKTKWFTQKDLTNNPTYNQFLINFKEFFIGNLYNQEYYNIINQNYILFIQNLCEHYKINYIFCDAFDRMLDDIKIENDKTHLITKSVYWGFKEKTFKNFLISTNNKLVWETPQYDIMNVPGMHPSELGYKLIGEELYNFINNNKKDIIRYTNNDKKIKIL